MFVIAAVNDLESSIPAGAELFFPSALSCFPLLLDDEGERPL